MITDSKSLLPFLGQLMSGLKDCLIDPIPDVRTSSAKALGCIVGGVGVEAVSVDSGENESSSILTWLLQTLRTENSSVERSGAAQGLIYHISC